MNQFNRRVVLQIRCRRDHRRWSILYTQVKKMGGRKIPQFFYTFVYIFFSLSCIWLNWDYTSRWICFSLMFCGIRSLLLFLLDFFRRFHVCTICLFFRTRHTASGYWSLCTVGIVEGKVWSSKWCRKISTCLVSLFLIVSVMFISWTMSIDHNQILLIDST